MQQYLAKDRFCVFDLGDIFPGHKLLVNISFSIVSLLSLDSKQANALIAQCLLTEAEMRMLLPRLYSPTCCQPEVLQAGYACTYAFLQSVLFSDAATNPEWNRVVQQQRDRLRLAQEKKSQRTEMRAVYNALFGLRRKLEQFGLTIRSRQDGYYLAFLVEGDILV